MINIEEQRSALNQSCEEMMLLCQTQMAQAFEAFTAFDTDLAEAVILKETHINALDLKIEKDTDKFIALYNPVATDLRFALALLKMNYNLERIGDQAFDIANNIIDLDEKLIITKLQFDNMYKTLSSMFQDVVIAFTNDNVKQARKVFKKDKIINKINAKAFLVVSEQVIKQPKYVKQYLTALLVMKKFEKIGDLLKNISENIIYYIDAKLILHKKNKK